jgi:hypothetical protein
MRFLEELEQKVLGLIKINQELHLQIEAKAKENSALLEQIRTYEASLLSHVTTAQTLEQEKAAMVNGIEELLHSINALEKSH